MSYDVEVFTKKVHLTDNYTSNVGLMYHEAYRVAQEKEKVLIDSEELSQRLLIWDDFKDTLNTGRDEAVRALLLMIEELRNNPDKYKRMNPGNCWGSYEGALTFLEGTYKSLVSNPSAVMEIDA